MKWHLATYADETFGSEGDSRREFIHTFYEDLIHHRRNREWLESTEFYKQNTSILNHSKTGGLWAWKPFIILDAMNSADEGDFIIYCDRNDIFSPGVFDFITNTISEDEFCLLLVGSNINKHYTKRDTFILMECDEEDYWNSNQLEAGFSVWKCCDESKNILNQYLKYCLDYDIVSDEPSKHGEEFPEFKEHRFDQSVLTNIAIKEGLPVSNAELRNFVECDYDYWYERGNPGYGREIDKFLSNMNILSNKN